MSSWACSACTFENSQPSSRHKCEMCGTAKPSNYVASSSSSSSSGSGSNNKRMNTTTAATLHKIPDDNSCLFHAVTFLLGRSESPTQLRQIIAQTVRSNPAQFSAAILGKSREAYVTFITDPTKWGGQVELNILSSRFCAELAAIDIQSGRCDIYGEGSGFSERVYLCFTGIHFDAVVFGKNGTPPHVTTRPIGSSRCRSLGVLFTPHRSVYGQEDDDSRMQNLRAYHERGLRSPPPCWEQRTQRLCYEKGQLTLV